jgi:hypothetical protein
MEPCFSAMDAYFQQVTTNRPARLPHLVMSYRFVAGRRGRQRAFLTWRWKCEFKHRKKRPADWAGGFPL